ncbi:MAG: UbiA family prenyltransferase, partial [Methanobacteriota archaeon]
AGFDILYALLDVDGDRAQGIPSIPADDGVPAALRVARLCHALFVVLLVDAGIAGSVAAGFWVGLVLVVAMLAYEHAIVRPDDPEAINKAFFKANAVVGWVVLLGVLSGLFISLP